MKRILYLGLDPVRCQANGEITHWPIIQIFPRPLSDDNLRQALTQFDLYTHVIITSQSTVAILKNYLAQTGISPHSWANKITLAVGKATAEHLLACGIQPYRIAKEETAEGLILEIEQMELKNAHFFWPHSAQSRPVIENFLKTQNISYTSCILYEPKLRIPGPLPELDHYDEIIFTSPSTIDAFLLIFKHLPENVALKTIGPVTARHLQNCLKEQQHSKKIRN